MPRRLTFACVLVRGNVPYTVDYVVNLQRLVRRFCARDHTFVCLTDDPSQFPPFIKTIQIPNPAPAFGWWAKVNLFNSALKLGDRIVYLDLDTLIVAPLDPIIDYPSPFALIPDAGTFKPKTSHITNKRYNSSVMVWNHGHGRPIFEKWGQDVARILWGDQDYIADLYPNLDRMPLQWFPRFSEISPLTHSHWLATRETQWPAAAKVILIKKPKPAIAAERYPWFKESWAS